MVDGKGSWTDGLRWSGGSAGGTPAVPAFGTDTAGPRNGDGWRAAPCRQRGRGRNGKGSWTDGLRWRGGSAGGTPAVPAFGADTAGGPEWGWGIRRVTGRSLACSAVSAARQGT